MWRDLGLLVYYPIRWGYNCSEDSPVSPYVYTTTPGQATDPSVWHYPYSKVTLSGGTPTLIVVGFFFLDTYFDKVMITCFKGPCLQETSTQYLVY